MDKGNQKKNLKFDIFNGSLYNFGERYEKMLVLVLISGKNCT